MLFRSRRISDVRRSIEHLGRAQAFYGATQRQIRITLQTVRDSAIVEKQELSQHRDTDIVSVGGGSHSGRSMRHAGTVLSMAATELIEKAKRIAAIVFDTPADQVEFADTLKCRVAGSTGIHRVEIGQQKLVELKIGVQLSPGQRMQGAGERSPSQ